MTVCIASDGFPPKAGGIVSFNWHLTNLLLNAGHSVVQINVERTPGIKDRILVKENFTQVWLAQNFLKQKAQWSAYFRPGGMDAPDWIATGLAMKHWLTLNHQKFNIDIVEASDFGGYGSFLSAAGLPPVVLTGHASILQLSGANYYPQHEESYHLLRQLEGIAYRTAAAIITHSERNATSIKQFTGRPVYTATMPWTDTITNAETPAEKSIFLGIGAMQPAKGILVVLNALRLLKQKGISAPVTWIGEDTFHSPEVGSLINYIKSNYADLWETQFFWKNGLPHKEVLAHLKNTEALLMPSLFETFGYTILEAAMNSKAIIASTHVGATEHFINGENILLVPPNDEQSLAAAMQRVLSDGQQRLKLASAAKLALQQEFEPSHIINERLELYEKILSQKNPTKGYEEAMQTIERYKTLTRKIYYKGRAIAKRIIKRKK